MNLNFQTQEFYAIVKEILEQTLQDYYKNLKYVSRSCIHFYHSLRADFHNIFQEN